MVSGTEFKKYLGMGLGLILICFSKPIVAHIGREHDLVEQKAKFVTLATYYPHLSYFAQIVAGTQLPQADMIEGEIHTYYQMADHLLPDIDAVHYLLGYCEYYMGNPDVARVQFEKSLELDPYFFWNYYDLGLIYFKEGDFLKSAEALNKGLGLEPGMTLRVLQENPFYKQIWRYLPDPASVLEGNFVQGQKDAVYVLADCLAKAGINKAGKPPPADIEHLIQQLQPKLF